MESISNIYYKYEDMLNGQINIGKYWFFGVIVLILILINGEINREIPTNKETIDEIIEQIRNNHIEDINWKRCLIVGLITSFIICYFILYPFTIPPGFFYFFITLIIFGTTYLGTSWISSHWWKMNDNKIEEALLTFKHNKIDI